MKPVAYLARPPRLLEQVREPIHYEHYSIKAEEAYVYWIRFFVRWHGRSGVMRHPREMGANEVQQFLQMLASERRVSVSRFFGRVRATRHNVPDLGACRTLWERRLQIDLRTW